jgi:aminoglycoside 6'-N-acetyltransferase
MSAYRCRPFTVADLPLAERWLQTPALVHWWGEPAQQIALVREDLDEPLMRQWIVQHGGAFLRMLAGQLLAEGASVVAIDPARDKHQARRACARAGFVGEAVVQGRGRRGGGYAVFPARVEPPGRRNRSY